MERSARAVPGGSCCGGISAGVCRYSAVHPSARGPRGRKHQAGGRQGAADVPGWALLMGRVEFEHWSRPQGREDMMAVFGDSVRPVVDAGLVDLVEMDARLSDEIDLIP